MSQTRLLRQVLASQLPLPTDYLWNFAHREVRIIGFDQFTIKFESKSGEYFCRSIHHCLVNFNQIRTDEPEEKVEKKEKRTDLSTKIIQVHLLRTTQSLLEKIPKKERGEFIREAIALAAESKYGHLEESPSHP